MAEDGTTFLDQFRKQITEIGNALGYVRMVRSGGLHHVSQSIKFVPELDAIPQFEECAKREGLAAHTQEAARNLDQVLADMCANFAEVRAAKETQVAQSGGMDGEKNVVVLIF